MQLGQLSCAPKVSGDLKDHKTWKVLPTVVYVNGAPRDCDETTTRVVRLGFWASWTAQASRSLPQFWCTDAGVRKWTIAPGFITKPV